MHFKCYQISFSSTRKVSQMIIVQLYCFVFILLLMRPQVRQDYGRV